ncbi:CbtB domain-containing protein [Smaragdicoccus niigatensis]|uniref:CbtB domain-containing protein n=1 Tax=Smaragdicoccus niigatensis TaxID=359359 RepID=UPI00036769E9|nr:CbtB domain-containing protein [Smaragdicoccus niigatensis]MCE5288525.1 CbtB-domain containing protein [Nocardiaceae bacterium]
MALIQAPALRTQGALVSLAIASIVVMLALLTLYLVGLDQGAVSQTGALLHEVMHDGRHLLGIPCH